MKAHTLLFVTFMIGSFLSAQTTIKMIKKNGIYMMPCKVNGLTLNFIFDTGSSNVSISMTEAIFMLKNGYLSENSIGTKEYYKLANGELSEGTKITLAKIRIGDVLLENIEANVVHELFAPLLLGQSALKKFKNITFDYQTNTLILNKNLSKSTNDLNKTKSFYISSNYNTRCVSPGIYYIRDDDIIIKGVTTYLSQSKKRTIRSFTYVNKSGFKLKYVEFKISVLDHFMQEVENYVIFVSDAVNNLSSNTHTLKNQISIENNQTLVLTVSDWDVY